VTDFSSDQPRSGDNIQPRAYALGQCDIEAESRRDGRSPKIP